VGANVDGAGDGDGLADVLVGAPYANLRPGGGGDLGALYVLSGATS
jgi:hypothetical protein